MLFDAYINICHNDDVDDVDGVDDADDADA